MGPLWFLGVAQASLNLLLIGMNVVIVPVLQQGTDSANPLNTSSVVLRQRVNFFLQ